MDTPSRCPECDCEDFLTEKGISVCSDCGTVVSETVCLVTNSNLTYGQDAGAQRTIVNAGKVSYKNSQVEKFCRNHTTSTKTRLSRTVQHGIDVLYKVCQTLNLPKNICKMSEITYKDIVMGEHFKKDSGRSKLCLAILCVYLVSNRENNLITLTEIWNNTDCTFDHFGAMLMRLEKLYPDIYPKKSKNIEDLVPFYFCKMRLDEKDKSIVSHYATNLVWLWRQALLVQSFNPIYVIHSAFYFAWKAANLDRCKISVSEFCSTVNIEYKPIICERVQFYYKILQDFYRCSPFYQNEEITQSLIVLKLKDMIQMKRIILWNYENSEMNFHNKRREEELKKESSVVKNVPYYLGDADFSDTEIDSYIRTDDEVRSITHLTQKMAS